MVRHAIPTARLRTLHRRRPSARPTSSATARRSSSRPTGWPPARAWSSPASGRGACGDRRDAARAPLRRGGRARRASRSVSKARRRASSSCPTARTRCRSRPARTTSACDDGDQRPEHRRHGRLFARAGRHADGARARHARDHHAGDRRHGRRRHALHRLPLRRADDRRGRQRRACSSSTAAWATPRRSRSSCA